MFANTELNHLDIYDMFGMVLILYQIIHLFVHACFHIPLELWKFYRKDKWQSIDIDKKGIKITYPDQQESGFYDFSEVTGY